VSRPGRGRPGLGIISGRRRQGKTYLLQALAEAYGGFYFGAVEATEAESLRQFADALARWSGAAAAPRLTSWDEAIRYLFAQGSDIPRLVAIDEFPYLTTAAPALPSILQREIDQGVTSGSEVMILLCGSALSVMGGLLSGNAPLRGRAGLEMVVRPFPWRLAARYWGLTDPRLAILLNAVVGGTAAYRQLAGDDSPRDRADFDDWVVRTVLSPASPLQREARYLLDEEPGIRDTGLYHSVLAAVASGNATRGGIASYIGRRPTDVGHHLNVLEDSGLLRRHPDVFRAGRSHYQVAEPLINFYHAIMRPQWAQLESGRGAAVWLDARPQFLAQVAGPHFEQLCRDYALAAPADTFGGLPASVGAGVVSDPSRRNSIEVDVVVLGAQIPGAPRRLLSLGEAKFGRVVGAREIDRLRRARDLLAGRGYDTSDTVLACYSGVGFEPGLAAGSAAERIALVGPDELYADTADGAGGNRGV
jgi:uncharacterized protein